MMAWCLETSDENGHEETTVASPLKRCLNHQNTLNGAIRQSQCMKTGLKHQKKLENQLTVQLQKIWCLGSCSTGKKQIRYLMYIDMDPDVRRHGHLREVSRCSAEEWKNRQIRAVLMKKWGINTKLWRKLLLIKADQLH